MNDRYLFKAKRIDTGEWVQGYLYGIWEKIYILWGMTNDIPNMIEVDPTTICQCTGLKDKNGRLIWENDIVKCLYNYYGEKGVYKCVDIGKVIYKEDICCFVATNGKNADYKWWEEEKEVIGNIFDNPELLERE